MPVPCKGDCALEGVTYLPAIPHGTDGRSLLILCFKQSLGIINDVAFVDIDDVAVDEFFEVGFPDAASVLPCERGVVEGEVEARFESFVEDTDSVAGEEEDAFVVLECSEEDCEGKDVP